MSDTVDKYIEKLKPETGKYVSDDTWAYWRRERVLLITLMLSSYKVND